MYLFNEASRYLCVHMICMSSNVAIILSRLLNVSNCYWQTWGPWALPLGWNRQMAMTFHNYSKLIGVYAHAEELATTGLDNCIALRTEEVSQTVSKMVFPIGAPMGTIGQRFQSYSFLAMGSSRGTWPWHCTTAGQDKYIKKSSSGFRDEPSANLNQPPPRNTWPQGKVKCIHFKNCQKFRYGPLEMTHIVFKFISLSCCN